MWIVPQTIEGRTITLQPLSAAHAADLFAAADRELFRFTPQAPPEWSVEGFEREIAQTTALPGVVAFAIVLNATGRAIGRTTYMDIRPTQRGLEIGRTWIGRAHQGTQVNPEAKFLMLRHAFEHLEPQAVRVQFTTSGSNLHSQRAIAKLGAVREGVLRSSRIVPGGPDPHDPPIVRDTVVFSIVDHEWPTARQGLLARLARDRPAHPSRVREHEVRNPTPPTEATSAPSTSSGGVAQSPAPMCARASELISLLNLEPHPEGGWYRETFRSPREVVADGDRGRRSGLTTIHFLLAAGECSRWHRVRSDEAWHVLEGPGLELVVADPSLAAVRRIVLDRVDHDCRPDHVVPADHWQAARPLGDYVLCACTVGPGFDFADFEFMADDAAGRLTPHKAVVEDMRRKWIRGAES